MALNCFAVTKELHVLNSDVKLRLFLPPDIVIPLYIDAVVTFLSN